MCQFLSWKEVRDKEGNTQILFLTYNDIYNTKKGGELRKFIIPEDIIGHGAIDFFYELNGKSINKECDNFSSPDNFPKIIADAIKAGRFYLLGEPKGLLKPEVYTPLYADYIAKYNSLYADYIAESASLLALSYYIDYKMKYSLADIDYKMKFWKAFSDIKNREDCWK